jgi:hypothetical protein
MSSPAFHRFDAYGPVCGVPPTSGVNAADMQPPEITCRRCAKTPPQWWERQVERRGGRLFLVEHVSA